ncbi:hypothetical protein EV363DRAFT_1231023 [Boletus edulis]|nr:hypothetical protein EV363DRAFT_1231023 [Boletus edulis]
MQLKALYVHLSALSVTPFFLSSVKARPVGLVHPDSVMRNDGVYLDSGEVGIVERHQVKDFWETGEQGDSRGAHKRQEVWTGPGPDETNPHWSGR